MITYEQTKELFIIAIEAGNSELAEKLFLDFASTGESANRSNANRQTVVSGQTVTPKIARLNFIGKPLVCKQVAHMGVRHKLDGLSANKVSTLRRFFSGIGGNMSCYREKQQTVDTSHGKRKQTVQWYVRRSTVSKPVSDGLHFRLTSSGKARQGMVARLDNLSGAKLAKATAQAQAIAKAKKQFIPT